MNNLKQYIEKIGRENGYKVKTWNDGKILKALLEKQVDENTYTTINIEKHPDQPKITAVTTIKTKIENTTHTSTTTLQHPSWKQILDTDDEETIQELLKQSIDNIINFTENTIKTLKTDQETITKLVQSGFKITKILEKTITLKLNLPNKTITIYLNPHEKTYTIQNKPPTKYNTYKDITNTIIETLAKQHEETQQAI